jgi:hypothetical protein
VSRAKTHKRVFGTFEREEPEHDAAYPFERARSLSRRKDSVCSSTH